MRLAELTESERASVREAYLRIGPPPSRDFDDGDASAPALAPPPRISLYVSAKAPASAAVCFLVLGADGADSARGGPSEPPGMTPMSNAVVDNERSSAKAQDGAPSYAKLSGPNYQLST